MNDNDGVSSPGTGDIGIPAYPGTNVADLLRGAAARHPDRPAVIEATGSRTWAELDAAADAGRRRASPRSACDRGERVVIALPSGADLALALFTVARAGLIAVPLGPSRGDTGAFADRVGALAAISDDHGPRAAGRPAHAATCRPGGRPRRSRIRRRRSAAARI